ncbi:MAG: hypothetical protein WC322_05690 [Candidatus Paceibacterota bacterium]|jgi:hypothetical protein
MTNTGTTPLEWQNIRGFNNEIQWPYKLSESENEHVSQTGNISESGNAEEEPYPKCDGCGMQLDDDTCCMYDGVSVCRECYDMRNQSSFADMTGSRSVIASGGRYFESGAYRDADDDKPRYCGFNSPLVDKAYGEYMHKNRVQSDGNLRPADNWKKGIPKIEYLESIERHVLDIRLIMDGHPEEARSTMDDALGGARFNINGLWHEVLKGEK